MRISDWSSDVCSSDLQPLDWSPALIEQSVRTLDRLYGTLRDLADMDAVPEIPAAIEAALDDDLDTPQALAEIAAIAATARKAGTEGERRRLKSQLLGAGQADRKSTRLNSSN